MDPQQLKHGLDELANDAEPTPVDVGAVMATARARTRARHATVAAGLATVALVGTLVVTLMPTGHDPSGTGPSITTAPSEAATPLRGPVDDERSRKLTDQLAAAGAIPPQYTVEPSDDHGADPVPLRFRGHTGRKELSYTATATLRDTEGRASIQIFVLKNPPGTPLGHYDGQVFGPCTVGQDNCVGRTLPDGTAATAQPNARPPAMQLSSTLSAQRPDGTYVQVVTWGSGTNPRPVPPLDADELFKFATVFSY